MSNSKGAPSNLSSATRELLAQVAREGSLDGLMAALGSQSEMDEFELIPGAPGAMTDGAKRRLTSEAELDDQLPMCPRAKKSEKEFPHGISSMEEWGQTLIQTGKYARAEMSYAELFDSKDQSHMAYCTWLIAQKSRNDLTAPIRDLVNFLDRASSEGVVAKIYFPGSSTVRKFKK